jgi:DnaJ like chaperone protein
MRFLIFICALIGLWVRGFPGLIVGATLGFVLTSVARAVLQNKLRQTQAHFIDATFAVMGALCKADGVVTRDEVQVAEQLFLRLQLTPSQRQAARTAFARGKAPDFELDREVARFARSIPPGSILFQLFLQLQLTAVAADGEVHPAEHAMLLRVARGLGLSEIAVAQLEALLRAAAHRTSAPGAAPPKQRLEDAYTVLGVTPAASESDIKRAYKKMIRENHPDRLAAKGLPESMRKLAEERAREINAAYDAVKKARGFG